MKDKEFHLYLFCPDMTSNNDSYMCEIEEAPTGNIYYVFNKKDGSQITQIVVKKEDIKFGYYETVRAIRAEEDMIHTTQVTCCTPDLFHLGYRIFVHCDSCKIEAKTEITLDDFQ